MLFVYPKSSHHRIARDMSILANLLKAEEIRAVIDKEFRLENAREAVEYLAKGRCAGKVVVSIG